VVLEAREVTLGVHCDQGSVAPAPFPRNFPANGDIVPTMIKTRILVVDDEPNITELVAMALRYEGFDVETAGTGRAAISAVETFRPALLVLDVMLPDLDGFAVTERLAVARTRVPILFLTARDAVEDKVRGLTLGGDDYVTKPFSLEELIARIRALLRRSGAESAEGKLVFADIELDDETHEVFRGGAPIDLTVTEFRLLRYLMQNAPRVLEKAQILDHVWNYDFRGEANIVETYVSYLRKKLDVHGPSLIQTIRGVGYRMSEPRREAG
jgi:two-component system, OmpR family, response regulator